MIGAGPNHEETEKRLSALLLEGVTHIAVDNMDSDLEGKSIWYFVAERPSLRLRILGVSKAPEIDNVAFYTCTGNNISAKDDLISRVLTCSMNVPVERPEKRKFTRNPVELVLKDRGKYLAAIFTIARFYQAAGCPPIEGDSWETCGWCATRCDISTGSMTRCAASRRPGPKTRRSRRSANCSTMGNPAEGRRAGRSLRGL